jgi:hypothetical protein
LSDVNRIWFRRLGYVLLGLGGLNVMLGLVFLTLVVSDSTDRRAVALTETVISAGFALFNGVVGFGLIRWSRRPG